MGRSLPCTYALLFLLTLGVVHPSHITPATLLGLTLTLVTSDPLSWVVDRSTLVSSSVGVSTRDPAWAEGRGVCEVLVQRKCTSLGPRYRVETCGSPTSTPGTTGDGYNRSMRFYACSGAPPPDTPSPWGPTTGQWGGGNTAPASTRATAWGVGGALGSQGYFGGLEGEEGLVEGGVELNEEAARLMARGSVLAGLAQRGGALGVVRRGGGGSGGAGAGAAGAGAGGGGKGRRRGVWDETPEHRLPPIASLPGGPPGAQWGGQAYNPSAPGPPPQYPRTSACSAGPSTATSSSSTTTTPAILGSIVCLETTPRTPPMGRGPVSVNLGVASSSAAAGSRCTCFVRHPEGDGSSSSSGGGEVEVDWSGGQGGDMREVRQQQEQREREQQLHFPLHPSTPGYATSTATP